MLTGHETISRQKNIFNKIKEKKPLPFLRYCRKHGQAEILFRRLQTETPVQTEYKNRIIKGPQRSLRDLLFYG